ncbi:MAG: NTP transferase domain-containing protein [Actinomycetes bacterium]
MTSTAVRRAVVVLAAGRSSRFGSTKQLAELDGDPLVVHAVTAACESVADLVVVVLGHDAPAVEAALRTATRSGRLDGRRLSLVEVPAGGPQSGSLASGLAAAAGAHVVAVVLADQPGITAAEVDGVLEAAAAAAERDGRGIARTAHTDRWSHPVAFAGTSIEELAEGLTGAGDRGGRDLVTGSGVVDVPAAGAAPADVDTSADLVALRAHRSDRRRG